MLRKGGRSGVVRALHFSKEVENAGIDVLSLSVFKTLCRPNKTSVLLCSFFVGIIHVASDAAILVSIPRIPICYGLNYVTLKMPDVTVFGERCVKRVIEVK